MCIYFVVNLQEEKIRQEDEYKRQRRQLREEYARQELADLEMDS